MNDEANPACACGCGGEVARPWNRYILGHSTVHKLTTEQAREARRLMHEGMPQWEASRKFGTSQTLMNIIFHNSLHGEKLNRGRAVLRAKRIIENERFCEQRLALRQTKRAMIELRKRMREMRRK